MAITFDTTNHIDFSGFTYLSAGTISLWAYAVSFPASQNRFIGLHDQWEVRCDSGGNLYADFFGNGHTGPVLSTATWYHIAITFDDVTANLSEIYIDGAFDSSGGAYNATPSGTVLSIGRRNGETIEKWNGHLDDVRIYNRVLAADEIATIYSCRGTDGIVDGLKNRWIFNEGADGTTATVAGSIKDLADGGIDGDPASSPVYKYSELRLKRRAA